MLAPLDGDGGGGGGGGGALEAAVAALGAGAGGGDEARGRVEAAVQRVEAAGRAEGFLPAALHEVVSAAVGSRFAGTDADRARVLRASLPSGGVRGATAVRVAGALPALTRRMQRLALGWLVLVFDRLAADHPLHALYGAFFHLLDREVLRPHACRLLYWLTRRRDVKPFRVARVRRLAVKYADEPWVRALADLYEDFAGGAERAPAAGGGATRRGAPKFKPVDRRWVAQLEAVRSPAVAAAAGADGGAPGRKRAAIGGPAAAAPKRVRRDAEALALPAARAEVAPTIHRAAQRTALQDVRTAAELVDALPRLELPAQLSSVLTSRTLQHWLVLCPTPDAVRRVAGWIAHTVQARGDEAAGAGGARGARTRRAMLSLFRGVCMALQEAPPPVEDFCVQQLAAWTPPEPGAAAVPAEEGEAAAREAEDLLDIVSYLRPRAYESLYEDVLRPLALVAAAGGARLRALAVGAYTRLFLHWWKVDWRKLPDGGGGGAVGGLPAAGAAGPADHHVFGAVPAGVDYYRTLFLLGTHADEFAAVSLLAEGGSPAVAHAALHLHETLARLGSGGGPGPALPFVVRPSDALVYQCLMSADPGVVSRLCGVLCDLKPVFERLRKVNEGGGGGGSAAAAAANDDDDEPVILNFRNGAESLKPFNGIILDTNSALWRGRALHAKRAAKSRLAPGAALGSLARLQAVPGANSCLSLLDSPAFAGLAAEFLQSRGVEPGTDPPFALKVEYAESLGARGFDGLHRFLTTFNRSYQQEQREKQRE